MFFQNILRLFSGLTDMAHRHDSLTSCAACSCVVHQRFRIVWVNSEPSEIQSVCLEIVWISQAFAE